MRNTSAFQPNTAGGTTKAYYPLNGNSYDFSGNTNTGTDTAITHPQGRFGQAAKFNGSTSAIQIPVGSIPTTIPATASAWIRLSSLGTQRFVISGRAAGGSDALFRLNINSSNQPLFLLRQNSSATTYSATSSVAIPINTWVYICGTVNNSNAMVIYLNGRSVGTGTNSATTWSDAINIYIGKDNNDSSPMDGLIDEVIIESRAWSAKEVETYYRKSMLNYRQKSFAQMVFTYTSELLKGSYTLTGKNVDTFRNYVGTLLKGAYTVVGKNLDVSRGYVATLGAGVYNLVGKALSIPNRWTNIAKTISTWTNGSKNSTTWTEESKNSTTWTNENKS